MRVSIHAPTRGATLCCMQCSCKCCVSIHAPTRGATQPHVCWCVALSSFNPRTHTGCDEDDINKSGLPQLFQSTHPHGVRPTAHTSSVSTKRFQSTHPHGVRHRAFVCVPVDLNVSIHAPTRGATKPTILTDGRL